MTTRSCFVPARRCVAARWTALRPLWEMWFLPACRKDVSGFFMKLHHAIADGVAGVAALGAFVDIVPSHRSEPGPPWSRTPMPSRRELFEDNLRRRIAGLDRVLSAIATPVTTMRRMQRSWPAAREIFAEGRAPRTQRQPSRSARIAGWRSSAATSATQRIARHPRRQDQRRPLDGCGRRLRRAASEPGESASTTLVLRAFVPVSLHQEQPDQAKGNVDAGMVVPLPIGERDDVRRLNGSPPDTRERKTKRRPQAGNFFRSIFLQRAFLRLMPRQRFMNAYVAERPGPTSALLLRRRSRARALPGRTYHRQRFDRRRRPLLRKPAQHHRRRRPGPVPGLIRLRRRRPTPLDAAWVIPCSGPCETGRVF